METSAALKLFALVATSAASALALLAFIRIRATNTVASDPNAVEGSNWLRMLVSPLATRIRPTDPAELEILTTQLLNAGRRSRDAVNRYGEERILAMLGGVILAIFFSVYFSGIFGILLAMVAAIGGIIGPSKIMLIRTADRREAIAQGLPPAVDLMTTCIDAGLSPEHAIARVARELSRSSPTLAEEFTITASEFDAGVSLPDALRRLARRVGLDDLSALCGVIAQAHGLGAPIGSTLREYAQSSRRKRMSLLEERAGKLAAQLTIPLALCLLPASMIIILGPAAIQLIRAFQ